MTERVLGVDKGFSTVSVCVYSNDRCLAPAKGSPRESELFSCGCKIRDWIMLCGGSRVLQHLSDQHYHHTSIGLGLGFCGAKIAQLSSFFLRPSPAMENSEISYKLHQRMISSTGFQRRTPGEIPSLHDCFSQREDDPDLPVEGLSPVAGGIVALGKFDALHIGHRELAIQASRAGTPYLLSFVGMAEVLGWEPRAPIVAKCDRKRVLTSWAPYCGNKAPVEYEIEFASVRHLNPQQFVEKLSKELRVCGVVAGENYRFGYKASGDASELVKLCEEYGISAYIINSVMDKKQEAVKRDVEDSKDRGQVSSTRVRQALAMGDVRYVTELLGRPHRLILQVRPQDLLSEGKISVPRSSILNLPPGNGIYETCSLLVSDEPPIQCSVVVDTSNINVETEELRLCNSDWSQEFRLLSIEFG